MCCAPTKELLEEVRIMDQLAALDLVLVFLPVYVVLKLFKYMYDPRIHPCCPLKINISFYKNMFQHIFVPVMIKHVLCNCQRNITDVNICVLLWNIKTLIYDYIVSSACKKKICWFPWEKFVFINRCMSVLVHVMYRTCTKKQVKQVK